VVEVRQTLSFEKWMRGLKDRKAAEMVARRIVRLQSGLIGDVKLFDGIGELRIDYGPGYRVYFLQRGDLLIVLLCGGDKGSQVRDIARARKMAKEV
jgi:putative addiction module killer protein